MGGANSAGQAALHFAGFAAQVTILHRGDDLRQSMSRYLTDRIDEAANIDVLLGARVAGGPRGAVAGVAHHLPRRRHSRAGLRGGDVHLHRGAPEHRLAGRIRWRATTTGSSSPDPTCGPRACAPRWPLERAPLLLESSLPGVFVAGDVRHQSIKRVAGAVGDGSMSVQFVHQYIGTLA